MRRYVVQHWEAGCSLRGFEPDAAYTRHGLRLEDAVGYLGRSLEHVSGYSNNPRVARVYRVAWVRLQKWDLPALERLAVISGDNDAAHWAVEADNYFYWVSPCFALNCKKPNVKEN